MFYFAPQVAEQVKGEDGVPVNVVTIFRWASALESQGYEFVKDDRNQRAYRDIDVQAFNRLVQLRKERRLKIETAAQEVVAEFRDRMKQMPQFDQPVENQSSLQTYEDMNAQPVNQGQLLQFLNQMVQHVMASQEEMKAEIREMVEKGPHNEVAAALQALEKRMASLPAAQETIDLAPLKASLDQIQSKIADIENAQKESQVKKEPAFEITPEVRIRLRKEVISNLTEEAQNAWERQAESVRFIVEKKMFGIKVEKRENLDARSVFLSNYITENFPRAYDEAIMIYQLNATNPYRQDQSL